MQTSAFGQHFQPDFLSSPHKENDIFGDSVFRTPFQANDLSNSVMKPIGTGKPLHGATANLPDVRNNFHDIKPTTIPNFNASVQKAFPTHLLPPNMGIFNVPPPPLQQAGSLADKVQPEPMSGAMFFANIQSRQMTTKPPQASVHGSDSSADSIQFKVIEEGKKKWPHFSEEKIVEGLKKVRQKQILFISKLANFLILLQNLFKKL
jgi:hypothetical protein